MKPEIPLKGGDEYDHLTRFRRWIRTNPGEVKRTQRRYWKRVRRMVKRILEDRNEG